MTDGTAILMYHGFAPAGAPASRFVVPVDRLEAQLTGLLERGYRPLSLAAYLGHRREHDFPPARSFVVTIPTTMKSAMSETAEITGSKFPPSTARLKSFAGIFLKICDSSTIV